MPQLALRRLARLASIRYPWPWPNIAAAPWRTGFADVVQKVRPSVFSIRVKITEDVRRDGAKPRTGASLGSGFFISPDGYAVTNAHVVRYASQIACRAGAWQPPRPGVPPP